MHLKYTKILTILTILLFITGCGNQINAPATPANANNLSTKPLTIATSFYPMYLFTLNVAQDIPNVRVINVTQPTAGCLHEYALTPEDLRKLEEAQVLIINGAGTESFIDKVIKQMPNLKIITASNGIELLKEDNHEEDNPHVWVSISNAITEVENIKNQLSSIDPANAKKYQENAEKYIAKLEAQRTKMHEALSKVKNRNIITFHEAFPYFAKEFGLNIVGVIEREPGSEPSAKDLAETIKTIRDLKVTALFAEPQYPVNAANTIAKETGAKVYTLDPIVIGPINDINAYIKIMDDNLKILQEALK